MNLICKLFGHRPYKVNYKKQIAKCKRCSVGIKVSYDMTYGDTIVVEELLK